MMTYYTSSRNEGLIFGDPAVPSLFTDWLPSPCTLHQLCNIPATLISGFVRFGFRIRLSRISVKLI